MKHKVLFSAIAVVACIVAIGLFYWIWEMSHVTYTGDDAYVPPQYQKSDDVDALDMIDEAPGSISSQEDEYPGIISYDDDELVYSGSAPIYVTIYSHNEDSWEWLVNTPEKYAQYRAGLVERAEFLAEYGIEWDWQSDQPVVEAMLEYEATEGWLKELPGGMNVLEYLDSLGVSLDPHAHNNNYADIAYLIGRLGVTASNVIGGTIHVACGREHLGFLDFESWWNNVEIESDGLVYGKDYPSATWRPEILSDPGKGGHSYDDWNSGVWKPGDEDEFYIHFPDNQITYIGEGYPHDATIVSDEHASGTGVFAEDGQYIRELAEMIADGEVPTGTVDGEAFMYTASIHVRDTGVVTEGSEPVETVEGLRAVLDELQPLVDSGQVVFVTFEDAAEIWESEYDSVPWRLDLFDFSFYRKVRAEAEDLCAASAPTR